MIQLGRRHKNCVIAIITVLVFIYVFNTDTFLFKTNETEYGRAVIEYKDQYVDEGADLNNAAKTSKSCRLPNLDPWDKTISNLINKKHDPFIGCIPQYETRSYLSSSGRLWIKDPKSGAVNDENCFYRCKHAISEHELYYSDWILIDKQIGAQPNCDIMEVKCEIGLFKRTTYKYQHVQIIEKYKQHFKQINITFLDLRSTNHKTALLMFTFIIIDSASTCHFKRAMPLTEKFIQNELDAVVFPYLNKVGHSSQYNAYGFLIGEQLEPLSFNNNDQSNKKDNWGDQLCKLSMNNRTLYTDFQHAGYRTLHFEDSANTIFGYPGCVGFTENEIEHNMRPFTLPLNGLKKFHDPELHEIMTTKTCREHHDYVMETLVQFMDKYKGVPKFSINWLVWLSHDEMDDLFHVDEQFRKWFDVNGQKFANSFVFFMSDHGQKIDEIFKTDIGKIEDKNPFLTLIVPEKLRSNADFMEQLKRNSKQLLSQYDIYSTLVEILEESHKWTEKTQFTNIPLYKSSTKQLIGSSLFHPLKQPRNCDNLIIPFKYCMCEQPFKLVNDYKLLEKIASKIIDKMNKAISESPEHANKCTQLTLDKAKTKKLDMQVFEPDENGRQIIRAEFKVLPSGGLYNVLVQKLDDEINVMENKFMRVDRYEEQTRCVPLSYLKNYCYCKDLLNTR
ncbi:hypothetical protein M3Y97_00939900 [Aphelenchoides bicaudatus]|nr:hypothetical protein M3Y97_00939900 [Aphelenchoides bicaudatus]